MALKFFKLTSQIISSSPRPFMRLTCNITGCDYFWSLSVYPCALEQPFTVIDPWTSIHQAVLGTPQSIDYSLRDPYWASKLRCFVSPFPSGPFSLGLSSQAIYLNLLCLHPKCISSTGRLAAELFMCEWGSSVPSVTPHNLFPNSGGDFSHFIISTCFFIRE